MTYFYFPLCLLILYLSKSWLTTQLAGMIHRFGGGHRALIIIWSAIFLPGTVIHELSHFFFAILTGARTGKIEIFPEYLEEDWEDEGRGRRVALGYVQTQRLNPIQGFLVGTAPFLVGLTLLVWLSSVIQPGLAGNFSYLLVLQIYLFFTVSNSFFPSWSDIKQTLPLIIITVVALIISTILGFRFLFHPPEQMTGLVNTINITLLISTALNIILVSVLFILNKILYRH